ncbi:hypothetical protein CON23_29395 [Bacillus thuringiensis]|nr:hypothetical protein CON23_29395 [Bacillus thuringiensis]
MKKVKGNNFNKTKTSFKILLPVGNNESIKEEIQKCIREIQDVPELIIESLEFEIKLNKTYVSYL